MKLKLWQKNVLDALIIMGLGFVLFNFAFLLAAIVGNSYRTLIRFLFKGIDNLNFVNFMWHYIFVIIILVLSWFILRSKLSDLLKASYLTMPLIVILTEIGLQLFDWQIAVWILGIAFVSGVLLYLYKTKRSWLYYFATIYVSIVAMLVVVLGIDI